MAGTTVDIPSAIAARQVLRLQGADPQARSIAITATAALVAPVAANFIGDAFLDLMWGTGGARQRVEVDLGPAGVALMVAGSVVEVVARWTGSGTLRVNVNAAYAESRPPTAPARTRQAAPIAIAGTAALTIPSMAGVVRFSGPRAQKRISGRSAVRTPLRFRMAW